MTVRIAGFLPHLQSLLQSGTRRLGVDEGLALGQDVAEGGQRPALIPAVGVNLCNLLRLAVGEQGFVPVSLRNIGVPDFIQSLEFATAVLELAAQAQRSFSLLDPFIVGALGA